MARLTRWTTISGIALVCSVCGVANGQLQSIEAAAQKKPSLIVNATGSTHSAPDVVYISLGVTSMGKKAQDVSQANANTTQKVIAALKAQHIANKDIQTSNYSIQPQINQQQALTGYMVSNQVRVTLRDIAAVGRVTDSAIEAGANEVQSVSFGLENRADAEARALTMAVKEARKKAQIMATAADVQIKGILQMDGGGGGGPVIYNNLNSNGARIRDAATPIESGELDITANVSITFEIGPMAVKTALGPEDRTDAAIRHETLATLDRALTYLRIEQAKLKAEYAANHPRLVSIRLQTDAVNREIASVKALDRTK